MLQITLDFKNELTYNSYIKSIKRDKIMAYYTHTKDPIGCFTESGLKFSIEKIVLFEDDEEEYRYTYENGFEEGGGFCKTIDEVLETIKEIVEESEE